MPVHAFMDDKHLLDRGLCNYWGYNTIGFFCPGKCATRAGQELASEVRQFKRPREGAAQRRHRGDSGRGVQPHGRGQPTRTNRFVFAVSTTARITGWFRTSRAITSTSRVRAIRSTCATLRRWQLIMDSLRYWVVDMHVDGFRFDLWRGARAFRCTRSTSFPASSP